MRDRITALAPALAGGTALFECLPPSTKLKANHIVTSEASNTRSLVSFSVCDTPGIVTRPLDLRIPKTYLCITKYLALCCRHVKKRISLRARR